MNSATSRILTNDLIAGILFLFCSPHFFAQVPNHAFDLVITKGHIIDGSGSPWYSGDIGIRGGKIAAIGNLSGDARTRTIDAQGKVVAPGFIDMLGQSEMTILVDPRLPSKIYQGITTEITGEGGSAAPLNDTIIGADHSGYEHYHITPDWRTFRQYFARLEKQGMGINGTSTRIRGQIADGCYLSAANADVAGIPGRTGSIDNVAIRDDEVKGRVGDLREKIGKAKSEKDSDDQIIREYSRSVAVHSWREL